MKCSYFVDKVLHMLQDIDVSMSLNTDIIQLLYPLPELQDIPIAVSLLRSVVETRCWIWFWCCPFADTRFVVVLIFVYVSTSAIVLIFFVFGLFINPLLYSFQYELFLKKIPMENYWLLFIVKWAKDFPLFDEEIKRTTTNILYLTIKRRGINKIFKLVFIRNPRSEEVQLYILMNKN